METNNRVLVMEVVPHDPHVTLDGKGMRDSSRQRRSAHALPPKIAST